VLSDRRQKVLSALIEEYVARALPVGSRTLVERYELGVSSATVRNELSILEDAGYIVQPHTSAGRIPTDSGYRAFVDDLITSGAIDEETKTEDIIEELKSSASELDELLEKTSATLSRLTDCLSIVLAPSSLEVQIKQISLVSLSDHQVLIVVITGDGQVLNRHIDFVERIDCDELARVQHILNKILIGRPLSNAPEEEDPEVLEALQDRLTRVLLEEALSCVQESRGGKSHRLGVSALLKKPEFSRSQALLPIMEVLEDDTVLFHIFDGGFGEQGTLVRIGSENKAESLAGVSVVAGRYGRGDAAGVVAVLGPTRMDYSTVIKAVHAAQHVLHEA
jgi:heat-inducible transcriptional repressor